MALPAGYVLVEPQKTKLPEGYTLVSQKGTDEEGLPSIAKKAPREEPREAPTYDPLGQVIGDVPAPLDYKVEGQGRMNEPGAFTTISDFAKQFIAPGAKAPFALPLATETAAKGVVRQALEQPESSMTSAVQPGLVRLLSPLLMQQRDNLFGPKTEEERLKKQLEVQRTIASIPSIPGAKALNKIGEDVQKDILGSLSPEAKKALAESQITGNIFKGEVDFGTNPNAYGYALQAANVFGSMAPVIATAMVTKSPGAGGFVGGTMAADEAATKAAEFINKIPDAELRQKSPLYAELIAGGASPKEARELTIKKAAESGAALQALVATFGDVVTGKLVTGAFDKTIAKLGTNRLGRAAGVGTASSLEEAFQETGEGLASDVTLKNVIPSKELGEDSAANFILGALGGAGPGIAKGALSEGEPKAPEREKYVQPEGGLAELMARQKGFLRPESGPPAAPTAQAPVPPAPPAGPAETIQAPGSEAMDTQAMLEELINSVNYPQEKAPEVVAEKPVEAPPVEAPAAVKAPPVEAPVAVEAPKEEAPKEEPTLKEQYDKAAKLNLMAPDAFRDRRINQEQYDQIQADYERIKTEYQASIPKATLTPIQQEATDIADRLEELGQKPFVTGMRSAIARNQVNKDNLEFYRSRLKQEQAKQNALDEGIERPSEKFEWTNFFRDDPKDLNKLKLFNSKAPPAVKQALQTVTDTLQALTDRLNDEGYTMYGTPNSTVPQDIKNLRSQIQMRSAGGVKLINAFEALNKGFNRSKKTTNQENLDAAIQDIKVDAAEAQKVLQRSIPEPEEIVSARGTLAEARKQMDTLAYKSGSLWSALSGKLDPEEVREIFGRNPSLGNKKLGVTKKSGLRGTYISELAANGLLDTFLPPKMRHKSDMFDAAESAQYIKDAVANKDYLPHDVKEEIENIQKAVGPLGDLIDEYLTIEEQNRELQIAFDEQREADQAAEIVEPEGEDRAAKPSERPAGEFELTAPTKDELKSKQDEIDRLSKENERLAKQAEAKAKADEQAAEFTLTGSDRAADVAAARGQKDIFAEAPAEEAPKDNKQEIADLRAEQKVLIRQIIKAGLQETPEQEARMGEIDRRINELEGKAPVKPVEKTEVKQRSVEEIKEELEDLQDQAEEELNKDKKKKLASEVYKLQGELARAEGRAAKAAAEEAPEEPTEEPEAPEGTVATPDGAVLRYPLAVSMVGEGYKVLALDDPRTYKDKGGEPHRTFEKGPLRIAMTPQRVLFQNRNAVNVAFGNPDQVTLEAIMVDPGKRNQGLATQAMNDVIEAADKNEITLYLEPVPIVNIKKNDFGLDRDQLVDFYSKFGFEFQEDSNKVMQRKPSAEAEVLPAEEPQIAGQVGFEPYTIEGDFTEVAEEQQRLMLEDQTENLSDDQVSTLEKHYGATIDSDEFFTKLREDVTNFIVKGATAVNGKIRAIIRQLANGVLAVGIAFNPQYMSQPINVMMPTDNVRTEEVLAMVPDAATDKMSEPAKRAFAVIYPALQEQMMAKDKLFIMADKPSGRVFVFNPDGSLLLEKKSLFGLAKGDLYVGDNDKPQNRITPAGLFDLKFVDAAKGASEKRTAGDYDTGTVLAINDPDGTITIMHSVWLKEKDAAQRAAALRNESPADSRYSFGCINVDAPTYSFLVNNHAKQMDGAALFIVPEAGVDVMSFITGKGAMSEDLARIKIKPVTKEVRTPQRQATQAEAKTKTPGREQQFFSLEKQTGTPAFKKFFGDSKVVDADGNPMVVYHGTIVRPDTEGVKGMGDILAFDRMFTTQFRRPSIDTVGSFFSTNPGEGGAQMYSGTGEGAAVYPVYLSIKNPYTTTFETMLRRARMMENGVDDGRKIGAKEVEALRKFLKEAGKDGIHIKADPKSAEFKDQDVWIALEPEQIKSATGNIGTFDESGNINMSLEDDMVRLVNQIADSIADNEKKRSPSFKRIAKTLTRQRGEGKITDEEYLDRMNAAIEEDEESRLDKGVPQRVRGADFIREKLLNAKRRKMITAEGVDLAEWFIQQNPALVDDLGISVKGKGLAGVGGFYNSDARIINLIKDAGSSQTATHEILHHLERMMPTDIQNAIRKAWLTQLLKANKAAKDPAQRLYFMTLLDAHIGNNNHDRLEIPKDLEKIYKSAVKQMQFASALAGDPFGSSKSSDLAKNLLMYSPTVTNNFYEYFDPSEFWAVNGSDIVQARYEAVKGGVLARLKNWLREFTQKIKSLLGLKSDASIIRALDSLAKSDGKFVTRQMLGTGEYRSIERRNYEGGEAPEPDMEIPEMSFMDDVIYKYGDKLIDTKRLIQSIQSTGRKINEKFDAYMKEENYHGRLAKRTKNFLNEEMRPVLEDMQERGVTLDELETFLLNRHAKEANAYIARINPTGFPEAGSSVSDAAADKYMAELTPEKRKDLMALAAKVDAIVKETQRVLVENGLETEETIKEWNATYKHYVPLQRDQLDFVHTGRGVMGGFATRGSASKRRVGSDKPVIDIFANIAMQRERALRRSEQARVGRALYGMAIKHPNPGFWLAINPDAIKDKDKLEAELISLGLTPEDARSIIQEPRQPMFDKKTGTVKYQVNPLLRNSPNVFPIRINGEDRFIFFNPNDPRALRMVESIKNLDTEKLGDAIGTVGMVTRWFASVNTQYNIVFGGVNFLRDLSAASLNLSTTEIAGKEKQVRANVLPALRAIYRELRGKGATTKDMAEMQDWFERFQMAGGQTGYQNQFAETKRKGNVVEQELKRLNRGNVKKSVDWLFDWLSDYNDAIENAVRLSAFKVAVESGLSEDKAASIAKNLTVNFNRKGARTGLISSLYAFFNAAVQGSARMVETLRGPMGKKIIYGGMFLGAMQAVILALSGFDDDEPPEFVKDKNLIIPIPFTDKKYLSVPMPLGFNMFPGFGRLAMEALLIETGMIRSRKGPGDKMMSAVSLVFDAFNPLGGAGNPLLMAVPTVGDPLAAIYSNRDAFGRPIYREDRGTAPTPGYERSRENASIFSKKLAEAINWATSPAGTQHTKGALSPTADQIDYFIGQITGGVGREIMKVGEFAKSKAVTQEEIPAYKLPIVGRFYGEAESPAATRSRFYENVKEMAKHEHEIKGLRKDRQSPTEYIKANPEARLWQRANNVENQIVKLNKEKRAMIERDAPREALKRKEDEILKKMTEFNDQVRRGQ
jgi:GNAT superfamily N-acetyltransferase